MKKRTLCLLVSALLSLGVFAMAQEEQKDPQEPKEQRETVKRYVDTLPLILANDDYCGIGLNDRTVVGKVFAAEDSDIARSIFSIHEVLLADFDTEAQLEKGDLLEVIKPVETVDQGKIEGLVKNIGIVRILSMDGQRARIRIEQLCDDLTIGSLLAIRRDREPLLGEAEARPLRVVSKELKAQGGILFLGDNVSEAAESYKVEIDGGRAQGLERSKFVVFFSQDKVKGHDVVIGNGVVVDSSEGRAIVKVWKLNTALTREHRWGLMP